MLDLGQISTAQASTLAGLVPTETDGGQMRGKYGKIVVNPWPDQRSSRKRRQGLSTSLPDIE